VNAKDRKRLRRRKRRIVRRLDRSNFPKEPGPVFRGTNVRYEVSDRIRATHAGGVGAAHMLAVRLGLPAAINKRLRLLKRHAPYYESDHVLNIAYNVLAGGTRLEDLELLRQDESYMDMLAACGRTHAAGQPRLQIGHAWPNTSAGLQQSDFCNGLLGAARIPDPTTAGDFLRRFTPDEIEVLMDLVNAIRVELWKSRPRESRTRAEVDLDGTITPTTGEKKRGMGMSHKGIWGYHPLLVSLANTREPLFIVDRPGNAVSHEGASYWIDKAVELALAAFDEVLLRGDTDFQVLRAERPSNLTLGSLTWKFDEWTDGGVRFVFGYDACTNLVQIAESLPDSKYTSLARPARYEVATRPRDKRENTKEGIVKEKGYKNIRLRSERVAEFAYRPTKCRDARTAIAVPTFGQIHVQDGRGEKEPHGREGGDSALRRDPVLLLRSERPGDVKGGSGQAGERALRAGEPDRATQERPGRASRPGLRPRLELGVHGDCLSGMDAEGVVRTHAAARGGPEGDHPDGVQAVPERRHPDTVPGSHRRAEDRREDTRLHGSGAASVREPGGDGEARGQGGPRHELTVTARRSKRGGPPVSSKEMSSRPDKTRGNEPPETAAWPGVPSRPMRT